LSIVTYSQICIKRSSLVQRKNDQGKVTSKKRFNSDEFSLAGQEKVDLLIQVTV